MDLTDEQWKVLEPLIGELPRRADGPRMTLVQQPGGPRWDLVDSVDGSPVGRSSRAVPAVPDLPPPLPALGARRDERNR